MNWESVMSAVAPDSRINPSLDWVRGGRRPVAIECADIDGRDRPVSHVETVSDPTASKWQLVAFKTPSTPLRLVTATPSPSVPLVMMFWRFTDEPTIANPRPPLPAARNQMFSMEILLEP